MNRRMILFRVGQILVLESAMLLLPLIVSLIYKEWKELLAFSLTIIISAVLGLLPVLLLKPKNKVIFAQEGFSTVSLAWIMLSLVGAVPFTLSGQIPDYLDAVFETVSGFTTTGATILNDVEAMSCSMLFWRSLTHWIGGMGILVLVMAIAPSGGGRSIHILRAEMAGPVIGKLVPKIKNTAKILYVIYLALTLAEMIFLLCGGMPVFDSIIHSLGTAGTGGFGIKGDSIGSYNPYIQWVITAFMFLFSLNFNLFYLILIKKIMPVIKNRELWVYTAIVFVSAAIVGYSIYPLYGNAHDTVRHSLFQVVSVSSTTGFSSADFDLWPPLAKAVLFLLMFLGGCAGSTAGGLKISRFMLMAKMVRRDIGTLLHPRSVAAIKVDGKPVDKTVLQSVSVYFMIYIIFIATVFLIISFDFMDFETNISAAAACCNNVGPGFSRVGPMCSFSGYSYLSKAVLSAAMLFGRLEIYPMLLACNVRLWFRMPKALSRKK